MGRLVALRHIFLENTRCTDRKDMPVCGVRLTHARCPLHCGAIPLRLLRKYCSVESSNPYMCSIKRHRYECGTSSRRLCTEFNVYIWSIYYIDASHPRQRDPSSTKPLHPYIKRKGTPSFLRQPKRALFRARGNLEKLEQYDPHLRDRQEV